MSIETPTEYEIETHKGRQICERRELGMGYCGSVSLETHIKGLNNSSHWMHSSKDHWLLEYKRSLVKI